MSNNDLRISRVQRTLRWFEDDIPLLHMRVKELSPERQESAKKFAAALIDQTRAELKMLLQNADMQNEANLRESAASTEPPCEPAD
jgi:hypothetical protein